MKAQIFKGMLCFTTLGLMACGPDLKDVSESQQNRAAEPAGQSKDMVTVDVDVQQRSGLRLAAATSFQMSLEGCASGLSYPNITEANANIDVYKYDQGCLVKLNSFAYNGITYTPSAGDPFTTWLAGDIAIFEDALNPNNKLRVIVNSQLSSPVAGTESISYSFGQVAAGADKLLAKQVVGDRHELSVSGQDATPMTISGVSFVGMTAQGAGQFIFTLECGQVVTGAIPNLSCAGTPLANIKYRLVKDTFGGVLSYDQAAAIFNGSELAIADGERLAPGQGGTTNGGFISKSGASVLTGPNQMHSNPNMILILQAGGVSYRYFNVDVTPLTYP